MSAETVIHPLEPVFAQNSRVLVLGTMPSPQSRKVGFYYGHPQNRFWKVLAAVLQEPVPETKQEKITMLLRNRIALWDVLHACRIHGADDASIQNPEVNDVAGLLQQTSIVRVYTTGKKAFSLYEKHLWPVTGLHAVCLPSTSPANCRVSLPQLVQAYQCILEVL
ncbi:MULTISPECIES: DNA-deoxyinosine glycosylase [Caproicibacterium]|uniref:DNA-deoxyinosine glycosylase n=1 Tax=Caproicibacterium argilliputei TaxID=3030016 RepID=A0AA97D8V4_9FIRM|nr:DNA-deoxyinosine glycosylase [Caproicibacterium argilliputei]WOC31011.1 DNA-deoxyinosine glycosylase [Caproicibacterium argilliputei]